MLSTINPTTTPSWKKLQQHYKKIKSVEMKDLFKKDPKRFQTFSIKHKDIFLDYSKNRITKETVKLLINLAKDCKLKQNINAMFSGKKINETEMRAVLHTAMRNTSSKPVYVDKENVMPKIKKEFKRMKEFSEKIRNGKYKGYSGKKITDIVNIGIGGSDLGSVMVTEALKYYSTPDIKIHFVSNVDPTDIHEALEHLHPETTLILIASKTFTTQETMINAKVAKSWFLKKAKQKDIAKHFFALSTNKQEVEKFGITNMFTFWDFVGGRYSLWSSIGLSIMIAIGYSNYKKLLEGAHQMDEHFRTAPLEKNIPVLLALIGIWYRNFFNAQTEGIIPYDQYLHRLSAHLQQTNMESNGKHVDRNGKNTSYQTGPIVWGEPGTNAQHSFFQLIHQGTTLIPCDFLAPITSLHDQKQHQILLSNFFAQSESLMLGQTEKTFPWRNFEGNKPTNSIMYTKLTPKTLGMIQAMYEHKIFTQGIIWNIYSFDQYGVELGKKLAKAIQPELKDKKAVKSHDASTNGLINYYKKNR